jgi:hypothetical protein
MIFDLYTLLIQNWEFLLYLFMIGCCGHNIFITFSLNYLKCSHFGFLKYSSHIHTFGLWSGLQKYLYDFIGSSSVKNKFLMIRRGFIHIIQLLIYSNYVF